MMPAEMKELVSLNLAYTGVTNAGLEHLKPLTKLAYLSLIGCSVTPEARAGLLSAMLFLVIRFGC